MLNKSLLKRSKTSSYPLLSWVWKASMVEWENRMARFQPCLPLGTLRKLLKPLRACFFLYKIWQVMDPVNTYWATVVCQHCGRYWVMIPGPSSCQIWLGDQMKWCTWKRFDQDSEGSWHWAWVFRQVLWWGATWIKQGKLSAGHASTVSDFPSESPVLQVGGFPSGCHGEGWTLRTGLAGAVMAGAWLPWDLTVSGQFCVLSERAPLLEQHRPAVQEPRPWCPARFPLLRSDGVSPTQETA